MDTQSQTRPVFSVVISILIMLMGAVAFSSLGVGQYPEIVPPTVNVTLTYPGASAETIAETVADPLEESINGVEDMLYMSSQSTGDGHMTITITFRLGTDLDKAQVLVQNAIMSLNLASITVHGVGQLFRRRVLEMHRLPRIRTHAGRNEEEPR